MGQTSYTLIAGSLAFLLSACNQQPGERFGVATNNNSIVQTAYAPGLNKDEAKEVIDLAKLFDAETDNLIYFEFDRSDLSNEAKSTLDAQAEWIRAHPRAGIRIYGHTDKVGTEKYNDKLGLKRAKVVAAYLENQGIAPNRLEAVASKGESEPVVDSEKPEPLNRRTLTAVVGLVVDSGPMRTADRFDGKRAALMYQRYVTDKVEKPEDLGTTDIQFEGGQGSKK